jgi:hypothetical protein
MLAAAVIGGCVGVVLFALMLAGLVVAAIRFAKWSGKVLLDWVMPHL